MKRAIDFKTRIKVLGQNLKKSEQAVGIMLIGCALLSLLLANSSYGSAYLHFWEIPLSLAVGSWQGKMHLSHFINDALMTAFFLMVGLEIKREFLVGSLSVRKRALLPVLAAIGGMLFPGLIYWLFNFGEPTLSGWAIPTATDIAFSVGVMALLGRGVPVALKTFLLALAIIDDLGAVIIIAVFYTQNLSWQLILWAGGWFGLMLILNFVLDVKSILIYLLMGLVLWVILLKSGIHATLAGALTAVCIPMGKVDTGDSPLDSLNKFLHTPVTFIIIPIFALANTALILQGNLGTALFNSCSFGIIFGLVVGKPLGIVLTTLLSAKLKWTELPEGASFMHLVGVGCLGGIGFTMSIFVSMLAFTEANTEIYLVTSRLAILLASAISAILGFCILGLTKKDT